MPRNPDAPRASEIHWLSADEKKAALKQMPKGESFSNFARRKLFNLPPLERGGSRNEETMELKAQIANLRSQIATNNAYAQACEATFAQTGRGSAANQASQHRAAARKQAAIEKLEAQLAAASE